MKKIRNEIKFWCPADQHGTQFLRANFLNHSFSRHSHEEFVIGVVEHGAEHFVATGQSHIAPAGTIIILNPDVVHNGHAGDPDIGWRYRALYPSLASMAQVQRQIGLSRMPVFADCVLHDPQLFTQLWQMHQLMEEKVGRMERDSALLLALSNLVIRHAVQPGKLRDIGVEPRAVRRIKELIHARASEDLGIADFAQVAEMSEFHMIRVFSKYVGLPPHAYLTQVRLHQARRLMRSGASLASTASSVGFVDQSHFTKRFRQAFGVTPGQFLAASEGGAHCSTAEI